MPESASELTLGQAIRACRQARAMSARALSLRAGLSESVVGKIESGAIEPSLRVFACVVAELDLKPYEVALLVRLAQQDHTRVAMGRH